MKNQQGKLIITIAAILVLCCIAVGAGIYLNRLHANQPTTPSNMQVATVLPQARDIVAFSMTDNQNRTFTNNNFLGHWTFVFFGFTQCGHICPTTMSAFSQVYAKLKTDNIQEPQFILVSIDPARDTVAQLNQYVTAFNPKFMGIVGTQAQTDDLTKAFNVVYLKTQPKNNAPGDDIDHSGAMMLINPQGKLLAFFSMPHDPNKIASDYENIIRFYGNN